jgi:hypothetical protein
MSADAYDLGAEQSLLGAVLTDPDTAGPALLAVPADAWWHPRHVTIAAAITGRLRSGKPVDPQLVLADLLGRQGAGDDIGPYLITLMQRAWQTAHAPNYADRVLYCAGRRNLSGAAVDLRQRLDESWLNGRDEPITDFTKPLRHAIDLAEQADVGLADDTPSLTLADLLAGQDQPDWLVPGLLERGERIILTGAEGLGKSYAISQFGLCLAAGLHPFTAAPLGQRLRVLVVDCENGLSQSRRRFRTIADRLGNDAKPARENLRLELRPNGLDLLGTDAAWLDRKVALNAPDLLIVGPLYRLHYQNMNDELAARELVRGLDQLRTRYGCRAAHRGPPRPRRRRFGGSAHAPRRVQPVPALARVRVRFAPSEGRRRGTPVAGGCGAVAGVAGGTPMAAPAQTRPPAAVGTRLPRLRAGDRRMTAPDLTPDPEREPDRLGDLFPDVTDHLAELAARTRVADRHTTNEENDHG